MVRPGGDERVVLVDDGEHPPIAIPPELRRAVTKLGMVGGLIIAGHRRKALGDSYYDPIYQADVGVRTGPSQREALFAVHYLVVPRRSG